MNVEWGTKSRSWVVDLTVLTPYHNGFVLFDFNTYASSRIECDGGLGCITNKTRVYQFSFGIVLFNYIVFDIDLYHNVQLPILDGE
jgi:hypothetical protein